MHDPVTWFKISRDWTDVTQWGIQSKGMSRFTGADCSVLEAPLRNLCPSMADFVPRDRVVGKVYCCCSLVVALPFDAVPMLRGFLHLSVNDILLSMTFR